MSTQREKELLLEQTTSAFRRRDRTGAIVPSPAWFDLTPEEREEAFETTSSLRHLEAALHPDGHSTTVSAVLRRLKR